MNLISSGQAQWRHMICINTISMTSACGWFSTLSHSWTASGTHA